MMFDPSRKQVSRWLAVACGTLAIAVLGGVAFASQSLVHDRRISLIEARQLGRGEPEPVSHRRQPRRRRRAQPFRRHARRA